jgi:hypothetical protein
MAEDSLVSYWEKFGAIAFDQSQKAILTSCTLKNPHDDDDKDPDKNNGEEEKNGKKKPGGVLTKCCFSFTIRRDIHNM